VELPPIYAVALSEQHQHYRGWPYVFAEYTELRVFQYQRQASSHYLATKSALLLGSFISIQQIPAEQAGNIRHLSTLVAALKPAVRDRSACWARQRKSTRFRSSIPAPAPPVNANCGGHDEGAIANATPRASRR
jgi:hypothetical protein